MYDVLFMLKDLVYIPSSEIPADSDEARERLGDDSVEATASLQ